MYYWFRRWGLDGGRQRILVELRRTTRQRKGRKPEPSAAIVDSQSVRIAEESGGNKGYDAAKCVPGRKRHLLIDSSGLLLVGKVTPANTPDNRGVRELLAGLPSLMPRLELIWPTAPMQARSCGVGTPSTPAGVWRYYRATATVLRSRRSPGVG